MLEAHYPDNCGDFTLWQSTCRLPSEAPKLKAKWHQKNHFKARAVVSNVIKSHQDILCLAIAATPWGAHMPNYRGDQRETVQHRLSSDTSCSASTPTISSRAHNNGSRKSTMSRGWQSWQAPVVCLLMRRVGGNMGHGGIEKREGGVTEALDVRCCSYLLGTSGELGWSGCKDGCSTSGLLPTLVKKQEGQGVNRGVVMSN